jgi:hypothetical protein
VSQENVLEYQDVLSHKSQLRGSGVVGGCDGGRRRVEELGVSLCSCGVAPRRSGGAG